MNGKAMKYELPDEETLAKYLAMLNDVLVAARFRAYQFDVQTAELLDAVHNVPDLLCRWPDTDESWVLTDLKRYEEKYCEAAPRFTNTLLNGPREGWQLKWETLKTESTE